MARVRYPDEAVSVAYGKTTKRIERPQYRTWVNKLPCVICGAQETEAAHLSMANNEYCHLGRGKGRKASDRWVLPLCRYHHREQTNLGDEKLFWESYGMNPYIICLVLFGVWSDLKMDGVDKATSWIAASRTGETV